LVLASIPYCVSIERANQAVPIGANLWLDCDFVGRFRHCAGEVTIAGEFEMDLSIDLWGEVAIWVTQAIRE
jgi:hypothetical protein